MTPRSAPAGQSQVLMPDGVTRSAPDRTRPVLSGSPGAPPARRWPGPPIGHPTIINATYWTARWWVVRDKGFFWRRMTYRALVSEGTCRDLREAVIAMHEKWRQDRAEIAAFEARHWHHRQYLRSQRHLARLSVIVHAAGGPCAYCGDPNPRTIDHVDPTLPRGRADELDNLVRCCARCNSEKGHHTPEAWRARRLASGLPWPPVPSDRRPTIAEPLRGQRITPAQARVLEMLAAAGSAELSKAHRQTVRALNRHGLIEVSLARPWEHTITDRGRLALETGRLPR